MQGFRSGRTLLLALCAVLVPFTAALAANTVTVKVFEQNQPVEGATVEFITSDGSVTLITDANGAAARDLEGNKVFRLKVNGEARLGVLEANGQTITITLD